MPRLTTHLETEHMDDYERSRTHLALNKDAPVSRPVSVARAGRIIAIPQVNGLHHRYAQAAWFLL
jgi:hypothetical protein